MNERYRLSDFSGASPQEVQAALERSEIVYYEHCPIELPSADDLNFLRGELPAELKAKNISYHPESDSIPRFDASAEVTARIENILRTHGRRVEAFLTETLPDFADGWFLGTTSFRSVEEHGRQLKTRSSNELVHIDAGAYGATNGARILRFFVNVNPDEPRVWATKGGFKSLMDRYPALWAAATKGGAKVPLRKTAKDRLYSGLVATLGKVYPLARVIDSSPYDRSMRRIHNYMKENQAFRDDMTHYQEVYFPPMSAWMVFTDGISHGVLRGRYAFVTTAIVPLANCQQPEIAPFNILAAQAG